MAKPTSSTRKSTAAGKRSPKASARASAAAKPDSTADKAPQTGAAAAETPDAPAGPGQFRKQQLMQAIAGKSSLKRSELREAADLILAELGKALQEGETVNLPPLGKISIKRRTEAASGDILITRIKLRPAGGGPGTGGADPLAEDDKQG